MSSSKLTRSSNWNKRINRDHCKLNIIVYTHLHVLSHALVFIRRNERPYGGPSDFGPAARGDHSTYRSPPAQESRPSQVPPTRFSMPEQQHPTRQQTRPNQAPRAPNSGSNQQIPMHNNIPYQVPPHTSGIVAQETEPPNVSNTARPFAPTGQGPVQSPPYVPVNTPNPPGPPQNQPQNQAPQPPRNQHVNQNNETHQRNTLGYYKTRDGSKIGKGFCLIMANFTNKYKGYERDITMTENFFRGKLEYTVKTYVNKRVEEMNDILDKTVEELNGSHGLYDRFVMFVLSEGDDDALYGCNPRGENVDFKLDDNGQHTVLKLKMEDIVKKFTHEQNRVPLLRSLPKLFFFQKSTDTPGPDGDLHPAGGPQSSPGEVIVRSAANADKLTVGADIFLCTADQPGNMVKEEPSWMIQHLMDIFNRYHKEEHFVDMITQLNFELSRKVDNNGRLVNDLLKVTHSLTEKFYLVNP